MQFDIQQLGPISLRGHMALDAPETSTSYLAIATALAVGLRPLASRADCSIPLAFLAAQATETGLKAYLLKHMKPQALRAGAVRHDLRKLWQMSHSHGLALHPDPTPQIELLVSLHASPYPLRYADPKAVQLVATGDSVLLCTEVEHLLRVIESAL